MKNKKVTIIILIILFVGGASYFITREENSINIIKAIITVRDKSYTSIDDNYKSFITKTNDYKELFEYIEKTYTVKYVEQYGSGYTFTGNNTSIILTSRQFTKKYTIWKVTLVN
jgi:hypothetical protein